MKDIFNEAMIREPVFLRNLTIHPVTLPDANGIDVASVEEVLDSSSGGFRELDIPRIDEIEFDNGSDRPVLMLDGEEITGSLQNRIIAASSLVEPNISRNIAVICAEEGRWNELGAFKTGYCSYPAIRALLSRRTKRDTGLQSNVWKEIERKLTATKTLSSTSSMHDIYTNLQDEVDRYLEDFESLNHETSGFISIAGGKILGCDIFCGPSVYRKFEKKLLRSYALDAIEHRRTEGRGCDASGFLEEIKRTIGQRVRTRRSGHFSLRSKNLTGQGLVHRGKMIHLSAFRR